jgi:hypothetical protein
MAQGMMVEWIVATAIFGLVFLFSFSIYRFASWFLDRVIDDEIMDEEGLRDDPDD